MCTASLGDDAWIAVDLGSDPMAADAARRMVRDARAPKRRRPSCARPALPAAAMVPGYATLDDPQMRARGFFEELDHPLRRSPGIPDVAGAHVGRARRASGRGPAPTLGQHTEDVLRDELGVTDDELERLRDEHVIGTIPYFG